MSMEKKHRRNKIIVLLEGLEGIGLILVCILLWRVLRYLLRDLGATQEERDKEWPGDKILERVDRTFTRAVDIDATPENIWPWIVQIGRDKAGFYSYELVENLAGLQVTNREAILPEFQTLKEGDLISFNPNGEGVYANTLKPNEYLVCRTWKDESEVEEKRPVSKDSWSFYIVNNGGSNSRLIIRSCKETLRPDLMDVIITLLFMDPIDFVMEYKMIRTIKRLAE